jgi:hypothetical protein
MALAMAIPLPLSAAEHDEVTYTGGTIPGVAVGSTGRLDTTSETALTFEYGSNRLVIPFAAIQSFRYSTEVTRHLGVLPAIAVGLLKARERRHYFRISFHDTNNVPQVSVFEVPKKMPRALQAVLQARVQQTCKLYSPCEGRN